MFLFVEVQNLRQLVAAQVVGADGQVVEYRAVAFAHVVDELGCGDEVVGDVAPVSLEFFGHHVQFFFEVLLTFPVCVVDAAQGQAGGDAEQK